ncbi:hypothetical protein [Streptomyces sp. URMC 123]|uniref:hypothetical protein n=1 Tax=Streptomyces sp. URMC 123 TaxID=3423403 RepID=UPI003F1D9A62
MAGSTPHRKNPFRRRSTRQDGEGGTGPAGAVPGPVEPTAPGAGPTEYADETHGTTPKGGRDGRGRAASLAAAAGRGVRTGGRGARKGLATVADRIIDNAPRVPVRDLATLRRQFPGLGPEELADKLVAGAVKSSAAVGASVGAAAMLPVPPALPAELAAEIVGVASVELKMIAELHEVYGQRAPGGPKQRATAYLTAWTEERGIDVTKPTSVNAALGGQLKRELRQQILKRTVRNLPNVAPFMIGAAVGAMMNRRDTRKLADKVREDLRRRQVPWDELPAAAAEPLGLDGPERDRRPDD